VTREDETTGRVYRQKSMNRLTVLILLVLTPASQAFGYSAVISISDLSRKSPVVVVAQVESIRESEVAERHERRATAKVLEVWKGRLTSDRIEYIASPSWFMCDTSSARVGETILLFLERDADSKGYRIAHFGRGRMPVGTVSNQLHAAIYEVTFPSGIVRLQPKYPFHQMVPLTILKTLVVEKR
jgi:hypothetical protein